MTFMPDDDAVARLLRGIDGPRPLPPDLRGGLDDLLSGSDPVARLASADAPTPLPTDLRERLSATMAGTVLPRPLRRRLVRTLLPPAPTSLVMRAAVIVVVTLLVAGGVATAALRTGHRDAPVVAGPVTTTTTTVAATTTTEAAPVEVAPTTAVPVAPRIVKPKRTKHSLLAYSTCDALLGQTKARAAELVTAYGMGGYGGPEMAVAQSRTVGAPERVGPAASGGDRPPAESPSAASDPQPADASTSPDDGLTFDSGASLTNVQEAGVDEPDKIKTDGKRLFEIIGGGKIEAISLARAAAARAGGVTLPTAASFDELLLAGDRLLAFGHAAPQSRDFRGGRGSTSVVATLDVSDLGAMRVVAVLALDGSVASSRLVNGIARIVVDSETIGPELTYPSDGSEEAAQVALDRNRAIVAASNLDDWVAHYTLDDLSGPSVKRTSGRLCACDQALHPSVLPGFATMTVLTVDPKKPTPGNGVSIQGAAGTIYASPTTLYAASYELPRIAPVTEASARPVAFAPELLTTSVHKFDITGSESARYAGSGAVPGTVKDQFSLSEFQGVLRIVTTSRDSQGATVNGLTTMTEKDGVLAALGSVGDLGKGEVVQSVRLLGRLGYIVTFHRTDPLFILDLSDPAQPRLVGELHVPGFSAYLHPIDDGHLLGIGVAADENGRTTGSQVSLFDVTDPANPKRTQNIEYGQVQQLVGQDHHAFMRVNSGLTVFPFWSSDFRGVVALKTSADTLQELAKITHAGRPNSSNSSGGGLDIDRSFVVGDVLYTVSPAGLLESDAATLADIQWLGQ